MSTRENIRLIARTSFQYDFRHWIAEQLNILRQQLHNHVKYWFSIRFAVTCQHLQETSGLVTNPIADPGVVSSIPTWSHTFMEIDHELFSMVIFLIRVGVNYKRTYVHEVLVNCFSQACPGKSVVM